MFSEKSFNCICKNTRLLLLLLLQLLLRIILIIIIKINVFFFLLKGQKVTLSSHAILIPKNL